MARCDEGYRCEVCGEDVDGISDSDLYLRYILGEVDPETLHLAPERHLRCNPTLAQFIRDGNFIPIVVDGPFSCVELDPSFVAERELRVTAAYLRLREIARSREPISLLDYPLPGAIEKWSRPRRDGSAGTA